MEIRITKRIISVVKRKLPKPKMVSGSITDGNINDIYPEIFELKNE